jgi:hypothetical protein
MIWFYIIDFCVIVFRSLTCTTNSLSYCYYYFLLLFLLLFSLSLSLSLSLSNVVSSNIKQLAFVAAIGEMLNVVDCEPPSDLGSTFSCDSVHREQCQYTPHTCGACKPTHPVGFNGDANSDCVTLEEATTATFPKMDCPGNCTGRGACYFEILSSEVQLEYGAVDCVGEGATCEPRCRTNDADCEPKCRCESGFSGKSCENSLADAAKKAAVRESLINTVVSASEFQDPTSNTISEMFTLLSSVTSSAEELTPKSRAAVLSLATTSLANVITSGNSLSSESLLVMLKTVDNAIPKDTPVDMTTVTALLSSAASTTAGDVIAGQSQINHIYTLLRVAASAYDPVAGATTSSRRRLADGTISHEVISSQTAAEQAAGVAAAKITINFRDAAITSSDGSVDDPTFSVSTMKKVLVQNAANVTLNSDTVQLLLSNLQCSVSAPSISATMEIPNTELVTYTNYTVNMTTDCNRYEPRNVTHTIRGHNFTVLCDGRFQGSIYSTAFVYDKPVCQPDIFRYGTAAYGLTAGQECTVTSYDSAKTVCECTICTHSARRRRLISGLPDLLQRSYGWDEELKKQLSRRLQDASSDGVEVGTLSLNVASDLVASQASIQYAKPFAASNIVSLFVASLWFFLFAILFLSQVQYVRTREKREEEELEELERRQMVEKASSEKLAHVRDEAIHHRGALFNDLDSVGKSTHKPRAEVADRLGEYAKALLPQVFRPRSIKAAFATAIEEHLLFGILKHPVKPLPSRFTDVVELGTVFSLNMFVIAITLDIVLPTDDGTCNSYTAGGQDVCLKDKSIFDASVTKCSWDDDFKECNYEEIEMSFYVAAMVELIVLIANAPASLFATMLFDCLVRAPTAPVPQKQKDGLVGFFEEMRTHVSWATDLLLNPGAGNAATGDNHSHGINEVAMSIPDDYVDARNQFMATSLGSDLSQLSHNKHKIVKRDGVRMATGDAHPSVLLGSGDTIAHHSSSKQTSTVQSVSKTAPLTTLTTSDSALTLTLTQEQLQQEENDNEKRTFDSVSLIFKASGLPHSRDTSVVFEPYVVLSDITLNPQHPELIGHSEVLPSSTRQEWQHVFHVDYDPDDTTILAADVYDRETINMRQTAEQQFLGRVVFSLQDLMRDGVNGGLGGYLSSPLENVLFKSHRRFGKLEIKASPFWKSLFEVSRRFSLSLFRSLSLCVYMNIYIYIYKYTLLALLSSALRIPYISPAPPSASLSSFLISLSLSLSLSSHRRLSPPNLRSLLPKMTSKMARRFP